MRPGITAAMIVKNEARCLRRCLDSMREWAADIIVVDTGSTDRTLDIAKECGARTFTMEWPGRFDVARNFSFDLVETEWTLWIDADEWFPDGVGEAMEQMVAVDYASAYCLTRHDLMKDGRWGEQWLIRMWRTHPEMRLIGIIHEHFTDDQLVDLYPGMQVGTTKVPIYHDGYAPEYTDAKARRNLPLLQQELSERPEQFYYEVELALTMRQLGNPEYQAEFDKMIDRVLAMQDYDEVPDRKVASVISAYFPLVEENELKSPRLSSLIRCARAWFPKSPTVLFLVAQMEIRRKNLTMALQDLLEIERMKETDTYEKFALVEPRVLSEGLYTNLALVAHQLGRRDIAIRNYERLLAVDPNNEVALQNIRLL
ncbi:MAG: glycosyltransferase [Fimbriimonadaceae bacterium]|nr:glycosyltransferase [Fimbriimonadaceae bacterium]